MVEGNRLGRISGRRPTRKVPSAGREATAAGPSFKPRYLALSLYWLFVGMMFNSSLGAEPLVVPGLNMALLVHLYSMLGGCVSYGAVIALSARGPVRIGDRRWLVGAAAAVQAAASVACYAAGYDAAATCALSVVGGMAAAPLLLAWAECYALLDRRELVGYAAASFLLSGVGCFVCEALGGMAEIAAVGASPLVLFALLPASSCGAGEDAGAPDEAEGPERPASLWRSLITLGAFTFAIGVMRAASGEFGMAAQPPSAAAEAAAHGAQFVVQTALMALLVWYAAGTRRQDIRLSRFYKAAILFVVAVVMVILGFARSVGMLWLNAAAGCCTGIVEVCGWVLLIEVARGSGREAVVVAQGRFVVHVTLGAGTLAALVVSGWGLMALLAACAVALAAVGLFLLDAVTVRPLFDIDVRPEDFLEGSPRALPWDAGAYVEPFARAYRFTGREREVFGLWITSHGLKQMQETLGLSESTLKTHIRHLYAKCGVHSRKELVALLESYVEGDRPA